MHPLEKYAQEKEKEQASFQRDIIQLFIQGKMTEAGLRFVLKQAFNNGHYTGHCRGELHVKKTYGMVKEEEII